MSDYPSFPAWLYRGTVGNLKRYGVGLAILLLVLAVWVTPLVLILIYVSNGYGVILFSTWFGLGMVLGGLYAHYSDDRDKAAKQ